MDNGDLLKKTERTKQKEKDKRINEVVSQIRNMNKGEIKSDVTGSYTGTSEDDGYPEQDADDL